METFLGIGCGPIQTGIFLSGAHRGGMEIVVADVDEGLAQGVSDGGGELCINVATDSAILKETIHGVRVLNPMVASDLEELKLVAARASEISTALPSVAFYQHVAPWLSEGFLNDPQKTRFIYTAENDNEAASKLQSLLPKTCSATVCLNTVIGKMSGVVDMSDLQGRELSPLCQDYAKAHLVESFNDILVEATDGIENRQVKGLRAVENLIPFEEGKLFGHNAVHFYMACCAQKKGYATMDQIKDDAELMGLAEEALVHESGQALCHRWKGVDPLFTPEGFKQYADQLLTRIVNPFLNDRVERIVRDLPRKLGWDDRLIGAIRLALAESVKSRHFANQASECLKEMFGSEPELILEGVKKLWGPTWSEEHETIYRELG